MQSFQVSPTDCYLIGYNRQRKISRIKMIYFSCHSVMLHLRSWNGRCCVRHIQLSISCNWVSTRWQWSVDLYKTRKETAIYKSRNNKVKVTLGQATDPQMGSRYIALLFLQPRHWRLGWVGGQHHAPAALHPRKTRYPSYGSVGGPQGWSGWVWKILLPPGFDSRNVQPVASRYIDWAIPAPKEKQYTDKYRNTNYKRKNKYMKIILKSIGRVIRK